MLYTLTVCQSVPPPHDPDAAFVGLTPADLGWRERALRAEAEVCRLQGVVEGLADRVAAQSELLTGRAERVE